MIHRPNHAKASPAPAAAEPYSASIDHVLAELAQVDLRVRARVAVVRRRQSQDEHFKGLYVSEEEVDSLLGRPLGRPNWMGEDNAWLAATDASLAEHAVASSARAQATTALGRPLALQRLQRVFGLDRIDVDIVLIALAVELDLRYEKLYAYLQDDVTRKRPAVELVIQLLASTSQDAFDVRGRLLESAPLIKHRIVQLVDDPAQANPPLIARYVTLDPRIVRFLLADDLDRANALEPLPAAMTQVAGHPELDDLLATPALRAEFAAARERMQPAGAPAPVVVLRVPAGAASDAPRAAAALYGELGTPLLVVDVAAAPAAGRTPAEATGSGIEPAWLAAVKREAALRGAAILWQLPELARADGGSGDADALLAAIDASEVPAVVVDAPPHLRKLGFPARGILRFELPALTPARRQSAWAIALRGQPLAPDVDLEAVAARFRLPLGDVELAAADARELALRRDAAKAQPSQSDLLEACRRHSSQRLGTLARKVSARAAWSDIVLPPDRMAMLHELCNHLRFRERVHGGWGFGARLPLGKGLVALFAGPSGTGKTLAASVIAGRLGLDLYKIDLAAVISKYIGETEKNLARIFDEAERTDAILFFDEADALFGKRSEVRDSHDRYANIEVGYLLQRMDEYDGMAILATNNRRNMDDAFLRRLQFAIEFPVPDAAQRLTIWQGIWPAALPRDADLDLEAIAERYELSGGSIRNVALAAAFLAMSQADATPEPRRQAAVRDATVCHAHVVRAIQREYQKSGRLMREDEALLADEAAAG